MAQALHGAVWRCGSGWCWTDAAGWSRVAPPDPVPRRASPVEKGGAYEGETLSHGVPVVVARFGPARS